MHDETPQWALICRFVSVSSTVLIVAGSVVSARTD
jgi:hypothetical protein